MPTPPPRDITSIMLESVCTIPAREIMGGTAPHSSCTKLAPGRSLLR